MKTKFLRTVCIFLIITLLSETLFPTISFALTGGPSQPEVQSFEPIATSEMVDVFTGDFVYNIPLLDVGGYPINISYHSGVTMDQESSWCGLGWNVNPGVINRNMRGLPDDFSGDRGDKVFKEFNMKPNKTYGVSGMVGFELLGKEGGKKVRFKRSKKGDNGTSIGSLSLGIGVSYNNYRGFGLERIISSQINVANPAKGSLNAGLNLRSSSSDGLTISPSVSYSHKIRSVDKDNSTLTTRSSIGVSPSFNTRSGLKAVTLDFHSSTEVNKYVRIFGQKFYYDNGGFSTVSSNGGSTISFGLPSYVPQISLPMANSAATFSAKFGASFFGIDATYNISGYYSEQSLAYNSESLPAFGYFNAERGARYNKVLHDFNREKDGGFTLNTPSLPLTNFTYDVYSVAGQGTGGMYRPYRSEVGYVYDSYVGNTSNSFSLGVEIASGNLVKGGMDFNINDIYTTSGAWRDDNNAKDVLSFKGKKEEEPLYEPFYFKEAGEKTADDDQSFFNSCGRFDPVRVNLVKKGALYRAATTADFVMPDKSLKNIPSQIARSKRQKRNKNISILSIEEAAKVGLQKHYYDIYSASDIVYQNKNRHHIGEITALNADGSRYVYGIPAYNTSQKEVAFSAGDGVGKDASKNLLPLDLKEGNFTYVPEQDNSLGNKHGLDNFFSRTTLPAYAHSYLLTGVLSSDFIDNDGVAGPSKGDMGNYTLFNYKKVNSDYKWRVPYNANSANANEGLRSIQTDDQGNYIYGTKELWYINSIESKNYIAIFETGDRADGHGVLGENGGLDPSAKMKMLKNIKLYFKGDNYIAGQESSLTPIKTVYFEYDYSLCPSVPNNSGVKVDKFGNATTSDAANVNAQKGKLTLKKIYFTYQGSEKGRFSPYEFTYSDSNHDGVIDAGMNPAYNQKSYDRWGNYKPLVNNNYHSTSDFPYVEQDPSKQNPHQSAAAWSLSNIKLPSGGTIKVDYESDDYAYVQDKVAMEMFKITGITNSKTTPSPSDNKLYEAPDGLAALKPLNKNNHHSYLHVELRKALTSAEFKEKYLEGIHALFFKISVNMGEPNKNLFELVPGYCEIDINDCGVLGGEGSKSTKAYIKLKTIGLGEKKDRGLQINPITKAALQFCRIYTPDHAFGTTNAADGGLEQVFKALLNSDFAKNIKQSIMGVNRTLLLKGQCNQVDLSNSAVRLLNPEKKKFGGGSRVAKIRIVDNASAMGIGDNVEYGQEYDYSIVLKNGEKISSGVASYEPMLGGDENPWREPVAFGNKQEKWLVPDDRYYMEKPFGESFFPAPGIGYSKVTVKSIKPESSKGAGTGKVVHEFYTAKDFPVRVDQTDLLPLPRRSNAAFRLLKIIQVDFMNVSQGYVVELNDMHGKPKAQWVIADGKDTPVSGVEYKYKTEGNKLNNNVTIINKRGEYSAGMVGVDFDMVMDMREQETESISAGLKGNLAAFLAAIFPAAVPLILPAYAKEHTRFRSAVATKVINRYGILEETIVHDLGSDVSTKNLAFDGETGETLLTQVTNNYDDPIFSMQYPAHWMYDRMGQAYKNINVVLTLDFVKGEGTTTTPDLFVEGDELLVLNNTSATEKYWVVKKVGNKIYTMTDQPSTDIGKELNGKVTVKIVRSGRRNQHSIPVGTMTSLAYPKDQRTTVINIPFGGSIVVPIGLPYVHAKKETNVLSTGAIELSDIWKINCDCGAPLEGSYNPYYLGMRGNWRQKKSWAFVTNRSQQTVANTRKDGVFTSFTPFWNVTSWQWEKKEANWIWSNEVTLVDTYSSTEIENKDALSRHSAATNRYNHTVPVSVSSNAQYKEVFFDSFEDYIINNECTEGLVEFKPGNVFKNYSHSGRKSMKVAKGGENVKLNLAPKCP